VVFAEPLLANVPEFEERWGPRLHAAALVWNGRVSGMSDTEVATVLQRELDPPIDALELVRFNARQK
jgi:hypothetical protein